MNDPSDTKKPLELRISRVEFARAVEVSRGFIKRTARVLGCGRDAVRTRLRVFGLVEHAARLRAENRERQWLPSYFPECTPAERLRQLEAVDMKALSKRQRMRVAGARHYWRHRAKGRAA